MVLCTHANEMALWEKNRFSSSALCGFGEPLGVGPVSATCAQSVSPADGAPAAAGGAVLVGTSISP